jgi:hypothetical protein
LLRRENPECGLEDYAGHILFAGQHQLNCGDAGPEPVHLGCFADCTKAPAPYESGPYSPLWPSELILKSKRIGGSFAFANVSAHPAQILNHLGAIQFFANRL